MSVKIFLQINVKPKNKSSKVKANLKLSVSADKVVNDVGLEFLELNIENSILFVCGFEVEIKAFKINVFADIFEHKYFN